MKKEYKFKNPWTGRVTGSYDMGIQINNAYKAKLNIGKWECNITFYDNKEEPIDNVRFGSKKKAKEAFKALKRGKTGHLDFREDWQYSNPK